MGILAQKAVFFMENCEHIFPEAIMIQLAPYTVKAFNASESSENKIHDDSIAKRLGFSGGLVPGVEVFGYMTHFPLLSWGRVWLECGYGECRFMKPVYDGHIATVTAEEKEGGLSTEVASDSVLCATGFASLPASAPPAPSVAEFPYGAPPDSRPPASLQTLVPGSWLGSIPFTVSPEFQVTYLDSARETNPIYTTEQLIHPGFLLRVCNWALSQNVVMPAWIHTGSKVQNLQTAKVGEELTARARIIANYEHKGHKMVDLDILVVADGVKAIARVAHSAIYQPRQLA
jgi:hypothetical protein